MVASYPAQAEKKGSGSKETRGYYLEPQGFVRIGIDYNDDGYIDRFEYISVYELEQARRRSNQQTGQRTGPSDSQRSYNQGRESRTDKPMRQVSGTVQELKEIKLAGQEKQHRIARIKTREGRVARVDLGPADNTKDLNLQDGDQITVYGRKGTINNKGMLMAQRIEASGRTVAVNRPFDRNLHRYTGEVLSTKTASFRTQNVPEQVFARVRLNDGMTTVVNLGPKNQLRNIDVKNLEGKQISFLAHRATIGNRAALVADQLHVDGETVRVEWTGAAAQVHSDRLTRQKSSTINDKSKLMSQREEAAGKGMSPAGQHQSTKSPAMQSQQTAQMKVDLIDLRHMDQSIARGYIGHEVIGKDGESLGKAADLFTTRDGKPMYVIVRDESGKLHPIPAQLVLANTQEKSLSAEFDKPAFQSSPGFDEAQLIKQENWEPAVRGYYQEYAEGQIKELPPKQGTSGKTQSK